MSGAWDYNAIHQIFWVARRHLHPEQQHDLHADLVELQRFLGGRQEIDERVLAAAEAVASEVFAAARMKR